MNPRLRRVLDKHKGGREDLIPLLQDIQKEFGYLPKDIMRDVAAHLRIPASSVYGVATFYTQFYLKPQGRHRVRVCRGTACHVRGSRRIQERVKHKLGVKEGDTTKDMMFSYETVACLGTCALAPVMLIHNTYYGRITPERVDGILEEYMKRGK